NFFELLDLGFGTGTVKYVAECKGGNDADRRNRMLSTISIVYLLLTLIAAAGIGLLALFFNQLFAIPAAQQDKAILLLWILGARVVIFSLPLGLFRGIL